MTCRQSRREASHPCIGLEVMVIERVRAVKEKTVLQDHLVTLSGPWAGSAWRPTAGPTYQKGGGLDPV